MESDGIGKGTCFTFTMRMLEVPERTGEVNVAPNLLLCNRIETSINTENLTDQTEPLQTNLHVPGTGNFISQLRGNNCSLNMI